MPDVLKQFFPIDISISGHKIDDLFFLTLVLTLIAFLLVCALLLFFIIRYRESVHPKALYTHGNQWWHGLLTLTLALCVFIFIDMNIAHLSARVWDELRGNIPMGPRTLHIQVLAQQFAWNFRYAGPDSRFQTSDDIETLNQLFIPSRTSVVLEMNSKDVIHSFFIPNFRLKQDVLPGMTTRLWFEAVKEGVYEIACAELCGLGHYRMKGNLIIYRSDKFEKWLADSMPSKGPRSLDENEAW